MVGKRGRLRMGKRGRVEGRKNWEGLMMEKRGRIEDRRRDDGGELMVGKVEVKGRKRGKGGEEEKGGRVESGKGGRVKGGKRVTDGKKVEGGKRGGYKLFRREEETYALNYLLFPFKMFIIGIAHFYLSCPVSIIIKMTTTVHLLWYLKNI